MTDALTNENVAAVPTVHERVRVRQVRVFRHSTMFYWCPARAIGLTIALINEG
jgi:hypothetical protein